MESESNLRRSSRYLSCRHIREELFSIQTRTQDQAWNPSAVSAWLSSGGARIVCVLVLTLVSAVPRFHDLGGLSLYADEDYTWLSAQSVLEGDGSRMPSGMPYRRAFPLTWLNAAVISVLGDAGEASYRATAAASGTVTPAVLFLTGSTFVGAPAALVASTMLSVSEWHVAFSRYGRMYAPFLLTFILAAFFLWRWGRGAGWLDGTLGLAFLGVSVSLHLLGITALQFALLPLVLPGPRAARPTAIVAVSIAATAAFYGLHKAFVDRPYEVWSLPADFSLAGMPVVPAPTGSTGPVLGLILVAAAGAVLGGWWGIRLVRDRGGQDLWLQRLAVVAALATAGGFASTGHIWGMVLAGVVAVLVTRDGALSVLLKGGLPAALLTLAAIAWTLFAVGGMGVGAGLRRLGTFPFPYLALLWSQFPGLVALFAGTAVWLAVTRTTEARSGPIGVVLAVLLPMAAIGTVSAWGGTRYLFQVYPYMLLAASPIVVGLGTTLARSLMERRVGLLTLVFSLGLVLSGVTGGHGIVPAWRAATLEHGEPVSESTHITSFRPDHRGPGEYVRKNRAPRDLVIAEEPITQTVYAGRVDFWLRGAHDAWKFLYLGPDDRPRDIYVNAVLLPTVEQIDSTVSAAPGRAWLITSGETAGRRNRYLSNELAIWLDSIEATVEPAFLAADGVAAVYCLNCRP